MKRREFLGAGVATAALTVAGPASANAQRARNAIVVFDSRFEEAKHFAAVATQQHGLAAFAFAGDATALWHDEVIGALARGTNVVGITAAGARFCMQLMAAPGTRFVHHVTHATSTTHQCWTGEASVDRELRCATAWPDEAARIAVRQALSAPERAITPAPAHAYPAAHLPAADYLESWVLAPAPAALRGNRILADWIS